MIKQTCPCMQRIKQIEKLPKCLKLDIEGVCEEQSKAVVTDRHSPTIGLHGNWATV